MEINIKEISLIINKLGNLVEEYQLNHLNYYNELNTTSSFWISKSNEYLLNETGNQKANINLFIEYLKTYILIFYRVVNELSYLGDNIKVDIKNREKVIAKLDEILLIYDEIIKIYDLIKDVNDDLLRQQNDIKEMYSEFNDLKNFINETFNKVSEVNILMKERVDKLNTVVIKKEDLA